MASGFKKRQLLLASGAGTQSHAIFDVGCPFASFVHFNVEVSHPGPPSFRRSSCSPSGLGPKHAFASQLDPGIYALAESQRASGLSLEYEVL